MAILERINDFFKRGEAAALSKLIRSGVICFLQEKSRDGALHQLVDALDDASKLIDKAEFYQAIISREKIVSTGIGMGLAIPHAKLECYDDFFIAIGVQKSDEGLEWDSLDGSPVKLIFMIGGPANKQTEYLKILSVLTSAIKRVDVQKSLLEAPTPDDVIKLFNV